MFGICVRRPKNQNESYSIFTEKCGDLASFTEINKNRYSQELNCKKTQLTPNFEFYRTIAIYTMWK